MQIVNNTNSYYKNFSGRYYTRPIDFYKKIEPEILNAMKNEGADKSLILELIKKLQFSPSFEKSSVREICEELFERIRNIVELVNNTESKKDVRRAFLLPEMVVTKLFKIKEHRRFVAEILARCSMGESVAKIAKQYNLSDETIRKYLKACGFEFFPAKEIFKEEIISLVKSGVPDMEIANKLGIGLSTVKDVRLGNNLKANKAVSVAQQRHLRILEQLYSGVRRQDIAKEQNVCKQVVDKIAEKNLVFKTRVKERDEAVLTQLRKGLSASEVAKKCGVSKATVLRTAKKYKFSFFVDYEERDRVILEALKTKKPPEVAKEFNLSVQTIYNIKSVHKKI